MDNECTCSRFDGLEDVVVRECGPSCGCGSECGNRSTQRGVSVKLKIVRDSNKGWSLCADDFIPTGRFVCEYAGLFNQMFGFVFGDDGFVYSVLLFVNVEISLADETYD